MSNTELTSFIAYVILDQGKVIAARDTFVSAIEAAEMHALERSREVEKETESVTVLADETNPEVPGFYGRWVEYDEKKGKALLNVFRVVKKRDGYIFAGVIKNKPVADIEVQETECELYDGYLVPYDDDDEYEDDDDDDSQ